jgi:hypothetical protein
MPTPCNVKTPPAMSNTPCNVEPPLQRRPPVRARTRVDWQIGLMKSSLTADILASSSKYVMLHPNWLHNQFKVSPKSVRAGRSRAIQGSKTGPGPTLSMFDTRPDRDRSRVEIFSDRTARSVQSRVSGTSVSVSLRSGRARTDRPLPSLCLSNPVVTATP